MDGEARHDESAHLELGFPERFRFLVEGLDEHALVMLDEQGRIADWNAGAQRLFGFDEAQARGAPLHILLSDEAKSAQVCARVSECGHFEELGWHTRSDGSRFWASVVVRPLVPVAGARAFVAVIHDLSERRALEDALQLSARGPGLEDTLASLVRLGVPGLGDVCLADWVEGEVLRPAVARYAEPPELLSALEARLAKSPPRAHSEELKRLREGRSLMLYDLSGPEGASPMACAHRALLRELGCRSCIEVPIPGREGPLGGLILATHGTARCFGPAEVQLATEIAHRAGLVLDNARLYRHAQQAVRARDDIIAVVSHDLRNLLNLTQLHARLLHRHAESKEERCRHTEGIQRATRKMERLIGDLLDVGRIEAGRLVLERRHCSARTLLLDAAELLQPLALDKGLRLEVTAPCEELALHCDRERMLQVLSNLVGNAIKFTPQGGSIWLSGEPIGAEMHFCVRDTGPGIPASQTPRLFERYSQGADAGSGVGLGLFIVRGLVNAHGGRVWVDTAPGRGSAFFFALPLESALPSEAVGTR